LLELPKLKETSKSTEMIWILRKQDISEVLRGENNDQLPARGQLDGKDPSWCPLIRRRKRVH